MFGGPSFGWLGGVINFEDTTGHFDKIIGQLYVRQALAHLIDQPAYVKTIFKHAAAVNYGPVPKLPVNPYTPANNTSVNGPYPYDPPAAAALLRAHGWKVVPGGQTTCQKAGSGAGECGAGIPAGTPLTFNWVDLPRSQSPTSALEGQAFASEAKTALGVTVKLRVADVRLPARELRRRRPERARRTATTGRSPTAAGSSTTTTRRRTRRSAAAACSTPVGSRTPGPTR